MNGRFRTISEEKINLSHLEKIIKIVKKLPIKLSYEDGKGIADDGEFINIEVLGSKPPILTHIYPTSRKVYYDGLEKIKSGDTRLQENYISMEIKDKEGKFEYHIYTSNPGNLSIK